MDRKTSTQNAIHNFIKREMGAARNKEVPTRQNKSPERDVESDVLKWANSNGFFFHVIEASNYNPLTGKSEKENSKAEAGFSDLVGNTPNGLACYVELKAKDRRSTLSSSQRRFLEKKISQNCFAVVVDSDIRLAQYWKGFCSLKGFERRQAYLYDCLPKQRAKKARDSFEEKFGF